MIALIAILSLAGPPPPPSRLIVEPALLARLQTLAAGLHHEIVLCLTGTTSDSTTVATGFTMPDPQLSTPNHATFGPCPSDAVAIWHNHPLEQNPPSDFARPHGDPRVTPRDLCALSDTDIRIGAAGPQPFVVVAVDGGTWCWWSRDQVRKLAVRNPLRGAPVPGQISTYQPVTQRLY